MLRASVEVEFCLYASVRPSLIELSPGQRIVSENSSTEVCVRRLNLRCLRENRTGSRTCRDSGKPRRASKPHTSTKFTSTLDRMEQWREVKAVEFWQPANDNIGAVSSVVLDVMYKLRGAHSCRAVLVFIHRQCANKSKTSTEVGVCALLVSSTTTVELQFVCSCIYLTLLVLKTWRLFSFGNFIVVSPPHRQA